jgi:hypothetical protein
MDSAHTHDRTLHIMNKRKKTFVYDIVSDFGKTNELFSFIDMFPNSNGPVFGPRITQRPFKIGLKRQYGVFVGFSIDLEHVTLSPIDSPKDYLSMSAADDGVPHHRKGLD